MSIMHIGFLTSEYPHANLNKPGGLGTSIKNSAIELVKKGVSVSVFVYGQDKDEVFIDSEIKIYKIAHKKYIALGWYFYRKHINSIVNSHIISDNIDVIEAPDWTGVTAFMKFRCPSVIRLHGSDRYFCTLENRKQKFKNYFFEKRALLGVDKIVSVSSFTAQKTNEIFGLEKCDEVIHNGINVTDFKPLDGDEYENQLLYFGTVIRKKGVLELAKAFNILVEKRPGITLTLLGKDSIDVFEKKSTISLFKQLLTKEAKKNVIFINSVPYKEVVNYIQKATVVVLPSFAEAFPMTWLEAMAMEKALITSNIGWAREVMDDGETGFTINPINHEEFASKLILLVSNSEMRSKFGRAARKKILNNFSSEIIVKKNIEYYQSLILSK